MAVSFKSGCFARQHDLLHRRFRSGLLSPQAGCKHGFFVFDFGLLSPQAGCKLAGFVVCGQRHIGAVFQEGKQIQMKWFVWNTFPGGLPGGGSWWDTKSTSANAFATTREPRNSRNPSQIERGSVGPFLSSGVGWLRW